ncbi:hypothetical protein [Micromonospora carbonacea]|uniref:hypothetical protein n=1 Tax=Micromonospora carbonacea TaxID=47853 RepID=UPI0017B173FF|nr:hypothetical protein [Micromonospora carbonacea]MBB5828575.1 hypothetical protein [Micromonospora carbonacea]
MPAFVQLGREPSGSMDTAVLWPCLLGDLDALPVVAFPLVGTTASLSQPVVEGAVADAEEPAEQTDRVGGLPRV